MSKINSDSKIEFQVSVTLTEAEARALHAITIYGIDSFKNVFYEGLGKSYLQPHESGLNDLFSIIKKELPSHFQRFDKTRDAWNKDK